MSSAAERQLIPFSHLEQLREARQIIGDEAAALSRLAGHLDVEFCAALEMLFECSGNVIVTGMGKAGLIGQKITATFSSTGTRAHFLHPAEAVHGDLGCLRENDVLLALSNSGETDEICCLLPVVRRMGVPIIAITAGPRSTLGSQAEITLCLGKLPEAGALGLAPSTTTTAMLAMGDALALVVSRMKGFTRQQFAVVHPAGNLGVRLKSVSEIMRQENSLRIASEKTSIREVFVSSEKSGRRTGAVILIDDQGRLSGLFTDSDLAKLLEQHRESQLDRPISEVMTSHPLTVTADLLLTDVIEILSDKKFSELPVIDEQGRPIGLIDITDVIGYLPAESAE